MKRHPALFTLSHDHHQGLILAQQIKKGAPQYKGMPSTLNEKKDYAISFYESELVKHFKDEEEILFPAAKNKNEELDNLITGIISEHRKMESLVKDLEKTDQLENVLNELGHLLEKHIRKEERNLFVMIEEILTETELQKVEEKLKELASAKQLQQNNMKLTSRNSIL